LTLVKSYKSLQINDNDLADSAIAVFNSSLFYTFYTQISDCWHFGKWHMQNFPIGWETLKTFKGFSIKYNELMKSYKKNRITRYDSRINGNLYEYKISESKPIIDQIDCLLAQHYGFTHEELDFIINYDIKYRMGKELDNGEDEHENL